MQKAVCLMSAPKVFRNLSFHERKQRSKVFPNQLINFFAGITVCKTFPEIVSIHKTYYRWVFLLSKSQCSSQKRKNSDKKEPLFFFKAFCVVAPPTIFIPNGPLDLNKKEINFFEPIEIKE